MQFHILKINGRGVACQGSKLRDGMSDEALRWTLRRIIVMILTIRFEYVSNLLFFWVYFWGEWMEGYISGGILWGRLSNENNGALLVG